MDSVCLQQLHCWSAVRGSEMAALGEFFSCMFMGFYATWSLRMTIN